MSIFGLMKGDTGRIAHMNTKKQSGIAATRILCWSLEARLSLALLEGLGFRALLGGLILGF